MEIERTYEKILNISAVEMYTKDIDGMILDKLRQTYNGRCENSTLIKDVKKIIKRSQIELARDRLDGSGTISVMFLAMALVYEQGSIMVGCEIVNIDRVNQIACKFKDSLVYIPSNPKLSVLRRGDKIITRVIRASYTQKQKIISVVAEMYFCPSDFIILAVKIVPLEQDKKLQAQDLLGKIADILVKRDELTAKNKTKWARLEKLFYPFHDESFIVSDHITKYAQAGFKHINMIDYAKSVLTTIPKQKVVYLTRHPIILKSQPWIYEIDYTSLIGAVNPSVSAPLAQIQKKKEGKDEEFSEIIEKDSDLFGDEGYQDIEKDKESQDFQETKDKESQETKDKESQESKEIESQETKEKESQETKDKESQEIQGAKEKKQKMPVPLFDKHRFGELQIIKKSLASALVDFLYDYYSYLKLILDIINEYTDEELQKSKLWSIYEFIKK